MHKGSQKRSQRATQETQKGVGSLKETPRESQMAKRNENNSIYHTFEGRQGAPGPSKKLSKGIQNTTWETTETTQSSQESTHRAQVLPCGRPIPLGTLPGTSEGGRGGTT